MDRDFAPIPSDSRVDAAAEVAARPDLHRDHAGLEGRARARGRRQALERATSQETVDFDEVISTFDKPTRDNYQGWIKELAKAIENGRGEDLNDAFANFVAFTEDGNSVLEILDEQDPGAAAADQEHGRHARRDQPPLRRVRPARDERERLLRRARVAQRRARRDDQRLPDLPRRVAADVRPPAASSRSTRGRSCASCSRSRSSCGRRCATSASSRPTSSTCSASSSR